MKIFVDIHHLKIIKEILKKHKLLDCTYVYGSRSRGDHKTHSDLDLIIRGDVLVEESTIAKMLIDFSDSDLPFTVDIIQWGKISKDFQNKISKDLVKID